MGADASSIVDKMGSDMSSMINETSAIIFDALSQSTDDHDFEALRRVKIFVGLSDVELKSLIDEIKVLQYRPGQKLYNVVNYFADKQTYMLRIKNFR